MTFHVTKTMCTCRKPVVRFLHTTQFAKWANICKNYYYHIYIVCNLRFFPKINHVKTYLILNRCSLVIKLCFFYKTACLFLEHFFIILYIDLCYPWSHFVLYYTEYFPLKLLAIVSLETTNAINNDIYGEYDVLDWIIFYDVRCNGPRHHLIYL